MNRRLQPRRTLYILNTCASTCDVRRGGAFPRTRRPERGRQPGADGAFPSTNGTEPINQEPTLYLYILLYLYVPEHCTTQRMARYRDKIAVTMLCITSSTASTTGHRNARVPATPRVACTWITARDREHALCIRFICDRCALTDRGTHRTRANRERWLVQIGRQKGRNRRATL